MSNFNLKLSDVVPQTLSEFVGNSQAKELLYCLMNSTTFRPKSFLVSGYIGCGKTAFASLVIKMMTGEDITDIPPVNMHKYSHQINDLTGIDEGRGFVIIDESDLSYLSSKDVATFIDNLPSDIISVVCLSLDNMLNRVVRLRLGAVFNINMLSDYEIFEVLWHICSVHDLNYTKEGLSLISSIDEISTREAILTLFNAVKEYGCASKENVELVIKEMNLGERG